jgi:hypothetical protein
VPSPQIPRQAMYQQKLGQASQVTRAGGKAFHTATRTKVSAGLRRADYVAVQLPAFYSKFDWPPTTEQEKPKIHFSALRSLPPPIEFVAF